MPGVEIRITDDAGDILEAGRVGRVEIRSPCQMGGYWKAPDKTAEAILPDGWIRSGDLGLVDAHGYLRLTGRATDMYIRGGYNVYPLEVEACLTEHPAIAQAAVVGRDAPVIGEIGVAFVVVRPGMEAPDRDALRSWCLGRLADYKRPDEVIVIEALPLTPMLKLDRTELRRRAGESPLRESKPSS